MNVCRCKAEEELYEIGLKLLENNKDKRIFAFIGEMGVGKTSFIKILCRLLGAEECITSPTFAIINEYYTHDQTSLYHFDLYRLNDDEVLDLGYEEYFYSGNYCFVEWADKIKHLLPEGTVMVEMKEEQGERIITF